MRSLRPNRLTKAWRGLLSLVAMLAVGLYIASYPTSVFAAGHVLTQKHAVVVEGTVHNTAGQPVSHVVVEILFPKTIHVHGKTETKWIRVGRMVTVKNGHYRGTWHLPWRAKSLIVYIKGQHLIMKKKVWLAPNTRKAFALEVTQGLSPLAFQTMTY